MQLGQGLVFEDLLGDSTGLDQRGESLGGQIPQAIVLLVQKNDQTSGLGVERAWDVQDRLVDKLLDLGVRHRAVLAELVDGAAVLSRLDETFGGHGGSG